MKRFKIILSLISFFLLFIFSCSTDVNVNGEWDDIPIVYCVLDQSAEYQYVKVNKSFLGNKPASEMAQHSDSLFYKKVDVYIHEYVNTYKTRTWTFEPVEIDKEEGYFANDKNIIWRQKMDMKDDAVYKLEVNINDGEHIVTGETELISGISITMPSGVAALPVEIRHYNGNSEYRYYNGENGKVYQMCLTFNYFEVYNDDTTYYSIPWVQAKSYKTTEGNSEVSGYFSVAAFYNLLQSNIPAPREGAKRYVKMPESLVYNLVVGDENYMIYMDITEPSSGLAQDKPAFANLNDGFGLMASRYNVYRAKKLDRYTLDSIHRGIYTKNLGFVSPFDDYYRPYF